MCMETNLFEYFGLDREDSDRVFIIAEMSANHNHDFNIAVETVKAAKAAGADAIKLQTYTADTLTLDCDNAYFQIKQDTLWDGTTLYKLYQNAFTPWEWQPELKRIAEEEGLICLHLHLTKHLWISWRLWMFRHIRSLALRLRIFL